MRTLASVLFVLVAACSSPTGIDTGLLRVSARNSSVTLTNNSADPVTYILATPSYLELADPIPCITPGGCSTRVAAGSAITVPYQAVLGYEAGERTAVIVHWRGLTPVSVDSVHRLVFTLR